MRGQFPSGVTGATSELLACADLLYRGYAVFRAVSPACECDLIILREGKTCRVEVKTAYRNGAGKTQISLRSDQRGKYDVLALVFLGTGAIEYQPELSEWFAGESTGRGQE